MTSNTPRGRNRLSERMLRNDDIFCSLLFDHANGSMRIIDFRGGNFQVKHSYVERILLAEGMRKIFTLIERDDMNGWQRVGYIREGTIPGYYKRSDAYIMSRIYDADWNGAEASDDNPVRKAFLAEVKNRSKEFSMTRGSGLKLEQLDEQEAIRLVNESISSQKTRKGKAAKGASRKAPAVTEGRLTDRVFPQFSREIETYYVIAQNRRTKQQNLYGAEFQDCFGNAKIDVLSTPTTKAERSLALTGLVAFIEWLAEVGSVALFALAPSNDIEKNALYQSAGFRNSGWLNRQVITDEGALDMVLWTRKLV